MARTKKDIKELMSKLTPRQKLYAEKYIENNYNASAAARAVLSKGSTVQKTIRAMHNDTNVKQYIEHLKFELFSTVDASTERIIRELAKIAFSDIRELYDERGAMLPMNQIAEHVAGAINSTEAQELNAFGADGQTVNIGFTRKVKLHDKLKALEMLGRLAGMDVGDAKTQQISVYVKPRDEEEE